MAGGERFPLRRLLQKIELRSEQQVSQGERVTGEVGLRPELPRERIEHDARLGKRGGDRCLIGCQPHEPGPHDALEGNDVGDAMEEVPVVDVHQLVHAGGAARIGGRQCWLRHHAIEVAQDRLRLVQAEVAVLEHRYPTERMPAEMLRRAQRARHDGCDSVSGTLFLKRCQHGA